MTDTFSYRRRFFVKNLLSLESLCSNSDSLEFVSFDDFVKYFLKETRFINCSIDKMIIPVSSKEELELLTGINPNIRPFFVIYLKDFSVETLNTFNLFESKASILIDAENINLFKESFLKLTDYSFFKSTSGIFRVSLDDKDLDNIIYNITYPFFTLPFFCSVEINWDFYNLQKKSLEELRPLIWAMKFFKRTFIDSTRTEKFYWDYLEDKTLCHCIGEDKECTDDCNCNKTNRKAVYSKYHYGLVHPKNHKKLYIDGEYLKASLSDTFPGINLYSEVGVDGNTVDFEDIGKFRNIIDMDLPTNLRFVNWEQNYLCNDNPNQVPYLCFIINAILDKGDIL